MFTCSQVLRCSLMATSPLDKQTAGYKSPHDVLVRLAVLFVMWS